MFEMVELNNHDQSEFISVLSERVKNCKRVCRDNWSKLRCDSNVSASPSTSSSSDSSLEDEGHQRSRGCGCQGITLIH